MQIIYDETGKIFMQGSGFPTPKGTLSYLEVSIQENKYVTSIDTSKDPAEPIFVEYPKSEMQIMKETLEQ